MKQDCDEIKMERFTENSLTHSPELRETLALWETTFDSLSDMMISIHDLHHRILKVNKAFSLFVHLPPEEIVGKHCYEIMHSTNAPISGCPHARCMKSGKVESLEFTDEKTGCIFEVTATPRRSLSGVLVGTVHVVKDITVQKTFENKIREQNIFLQSLTEDLKKQTQKADNANFAKSRFLATMSHEIRTPLNGIIGMSGLLNATNMNGEQRKYAEIMRTSATALLDIINDILDFSKIEAGKLTLENIDFDLRTAIEDAMEVLSVKAFDRKLRLGYVIAPIVPSFVNGDQGRLRQIIVNLVGNAVKFTQQGEVSVRVDLEAQNEETIKLKISVSDTGIGIPQDRLKEIFEPFVQGDPTTTRQFGGTGLGLTISKQLVALMNGEISIESVLGEGSTIRFTATFGKSQRTAPPPAHADLFIGLKVLIADDHEMNRLLLTTFLQETGCRFALASDAKQTSELLDSAEKKQDPFKVAFIDVRLWDGDGAELNRRIKSAHSRYNTTLISMVSLGSTDDPNRIRQAGFSEMLYKPVRRLQFMECLSSATGFTVRRQEANPTGCSSNPSQERHTRKPCKILIVEDNSTNQEVALSILRKLGYYADTVWNGAEAVEALKKNLYDIVFMDCQMPVMDGYRATAEIRNSASGTLDPHVPIIAMTANALKEDRDKCLAAGMDNYMSKPIEPTMIVNVINRWHNKNKKIEDKMIVTEADDVFRQKEFYDRLMGDHELAEKILNKFIQESANQLLTLKNALNAQDETATRLAHSVKGSSSNIGAARMQKTAADIERMCKEGNFDSAVSLYPKLESALEELKKVLIDKGH